MKKKGKANILENCKCQQVNMAKNTGDKQRSPRAAVDSICKMRPYLFLAISFLEQSFGFEVTLFDER